MKYIEFDSSKKYDLILLGRIAVDLNPVDYYCPLNESTTFKRYLGGSPANIAVGLARLGKKCGFFARVSDDQLGTFVTDFFEKEGIDTSRVKRCENGEKIGLTFTEIKSEKVGRRWNWRHRRSSTDRDSLCTCSELLGKCGRRCTQICDHRSSRRSDFPDWRPGSISDQAIP